MQDIKEHFRKYRVRAKTVNEFLDKYYKHNRYTGRDGNIWGSDYSKCIKASCQLDLERFGYCIISKYESRTGEIVAFYPPAKRYFDIAAKGCSQQVFDFAKI